MCVRGKAILIDCPNKTTKPRDCKQWYATAYRVVMEVSLCFKAL